MTGASDRNPDDSRYSQLDTSRAHDIMEAMLSRIRSGKYAVGDRLPSERELVTEFHASRDTIRRAIQDLETRGYARRRGTSGTFVEDWQALDLDNSVGNFMFDTLANMHRERLRRPAKSSSELFRAGFMLTTSLDTTGKVLSEDPPALIPASESISADLELPVRALVMRRRITYGTDEGIPYETVESYYPATEFLELFRIGVDEASLSAWLTEHYEPRAKRVTEDIQAHPGFGKFGMEFNLPRTNDVVVKIRRLVRDAEGHVLQVDHITMPGMLCKLRYELTRPET